jgi:hypothetical protein
MALVRGARLDAPLPAGIRRLPGPAVVLAERWATSPVGPYLSLGVGVPARIRLHAGVCFTTNVVSTVESRAAGMAHWGFPHECGTLRWTAKEDGAEVVWEERGLVVEAAYARRRVRLNVPMRGVQARGDEPVVVPVRMHGLVRRARVVIEVPGDDPLARLAGRRVGFHVGGLEMVLRPATVPVGLRARLRAAERGVEPGIP